MMEVKVYYNPYKPLTTVTIDGENVTQDSYLAYMFNHRLQEWTEPAEGWNGFLKTLRDTTGEDSVRILFTGTALDFADLEECVQCSNGVFDRVELIHENKDAVDEPEKRQQKLRDLLSELKDSGIEEFASDEELESAFRAAISPEFEIFVVAPMSSGKSTLLNALIGKKLLPAKNQATTAVLTRICDNDDLPGFQVTAWDTRDELVHVRRTEDGKFCVDPHGEIVSEMPAQPGLIDFLNDAKDPSDPEQKKALVSTIVLEGPIESLPSDRVRAVFVDTPGGNNAQNEQHRKLMQEAIESKDKSIILYIFNAQQLTTTDNQGILNAIAEEMQEGRDNKQTRDRFLFVANRMDALDPTVEPYEEIVDSVQKQLREKNIEDPRLFPVSAQTAKVARLKLNGEKMSRNEVLDYQMLAANFGCSAIEPLDEGSELKTDVFRLYRHASISERSKAAFDTDLAKLAAEDPTNTAAPMIINSGVAALEGAVREYIEKYAICIKISDFYQRFNARLRDKTLKDLFMERCYADNQELDRVNAALRDRESDRKRYEIMERCTKNINEIRLDRKKFERYSRDLEMRLLTHTRNLDDRVSKQEAQEIVKDFQQDAKQALDQLGTELIQTLNQDVIRKVNEILMEYRNAYAKMEESGALQIGGLQLTALSSFQKYSMESASRLTKQYIKTETKTTTRRVKVEKSGFFNRVRRFFGSSKGWAYETYTDTTTVEKVEVKRLIRDEIARIITEFGAESEKEVNEKWQEAEAIKQEMRDKIDGINQAIDNIRREIERATSSKEALQKTIEQNRQKQQWLDDFLQKIENILEI